MKKVLLTTGGTGGHIFPALAVAEELRRRWPGVELLFMGSLYGPEQRLTAQAGVPFEGLQVRGFLGRGFRAVGAGAQMAVALCRATGIVRRFRPQVVAGFGGYAALAPMLAARFCGVPGILHEQNAIAGSTNRILARLVRTVCTSLPDTKGFTGRNCVLTGNPVRTAIAGVGQRERYFTTRRLLVMGGSQGARILNLTLPECLPFLRRAGVEILHQCGRADLEKTQAAYVTAGYGADAVTAFIDDMADAYAWADMVLCRSGASSVAELCAAGLPAILVPFAAAVHDHQTCNAQVMERAGAALLIPENRLSNTSLGHLIVELLDDVPRRIAMSAAALRVARPAAAARVADVLAAMPYS